MLKLADGSYRPVRCGRSNSCAYCAWQAAAQNMLVVGIDARERMPRHGITLTTKDPAFDQTRFREAIAVWFRWLRREVGPAQYLGLLEWTTGRAATSGGHRRMHQHTLVKGLPDDVDLDDLWRHGKTRWERLTGAYRIELRELRTPMGALAYTVGHHHKGDQAPPPGWSGKRFRPSKGYFERPIVELRAEAARDRSRRVRLLKLVDELQEQDVDPDQLDEELWQQLLKPPAPPTVVRVKMTPLGRLYDLDSGQVIPELERVANPPRRPLAAS